MMSLLVTVFLCYATSSMAQRFTPIAFTLPQPPALTGALSPNYALYNVEKLHNRRIMGTTSFAFFNGSVYTITADRKVMDLAPCIPKLIVNLSAPRCTTHATCGLLSSIRVSSDGQLLVLDAYRGLYKVNPANGAVKQLYSSTTAVGGRAPRYLNDMVETADGIILMSDSSDKFDAFNDIYIIMEGRPSGRILALNPTTGAITEVLRDVVVYPNGLELTADGTALLVAETGRARILRVSLLAATYKQTSIFANNLPGLPGNIRRSARGTFWVGLSLIRHRGIRNSMDMFSNNPVARLQTVTRVDQNTIRSYYPKYGLVLEMDPTGKIIGSLHDPSGQVYSAVSEVAEQEGLLYIAASNNAFAGRIVLPQGDGRVVTVDSVIQVMRSRCQIPEDKLEQAKAVLNKYIEQQTGNTGAQSTPTSEIRPITTQPTNPTTTLAGVSTTQSLSILSTSTPPTATTTNSLLADTTTNPQAASDTTTLSLPVTDSSQSTTTIGAAATPSPDTTGTTTLAAAEVGSTAAAAVTATSAPVAATMSLGVTTSAPLFAETDTTTSTPSPLVP